MAERTGLTHQDQITALQHDFPLWQVWVVPHIIGPDVWCARLWQDHKVILNADSASELRGYLNDHTGGQVMS